MIRNTKYLKDVEYVANFKLPYDDLNHKTILITGASAGYMVLMMIMALIYIILFEFFLSGMEKKEQPV